MKWFIAALIGILGSSLVSCGTYSDDELTEFDKKIQDYLAEKDIVCKKSDSGLYYKIIEEGEGEYIKFTNKVSFTYTGEFMDGEVFDAQKDPVEFNVADLIGAWKEIMLQVKKGAKIYLIAPPQLGYGTNKLDDIPPSSILVYNMEILEVK